MNRQLPTVLSHLVALLLLGLSILAPYQVHSATFYYSAPYLYSFSCAGNLPSFPSIGEAVNDWWIRYQGCYPWAFPGCSYQLSLYPDGRTTGSFAGMLLQGTCVGGDGVFGTIYPYDLAKNNGCPPISCGNPINTAIGNKFQR
ncbi:MAG: hypothetical protein U1F68_05555 [Gammaproteobacteria bacterium]